jgi:hypothetical protein
MDRPVRADLAGAVTAPVFGTWQRLFDHRLANEVDSAFGVAMGDRPQMDRPAADRAPDLNPRRVDTGGVTCKHDRLPTRWFSR